MLYQLYEWQRMALSPVEAAAKQTAFWLKNPFNPLSYLSHTQAFASLMDSYANNTAQYQRPNFEFTPKIINGTWARVCEETMYKTPFCHLLRFSYHDEKGAPIPLSDPISIAPTNNSKQAKNKQTVPRVLLISPMSGNYAVVFQDCISCLLPHAEVWVTDWLDIRNIPATAGEFGLDEEVAHIIQFIDFIKPDHVIGFSQSSNPAIMALSVMAEDMGSHHPQSLAIIGGPVDTRINAQTMTTTDPQGSIAKMLCPDGDTQKTLQWVRDNLLTQVPLGYAGEGRLVFPGFFQHAGLMGLHLEKKMKTQFEHLSTAIMGNQARSAQMEKKNTNLNSVMDLSAKLYLDNLEHFFLHHSLPKGKLFFRGKLIQPEKVTQTALICIEGDRDMLCPSGQTIAAHNLFGGLKPSQKHALLVKDCGHFGLVGGRRFCERVFPFLLSFMRQSC